MRRTIVRHESYAANPSHGFKPWHGYIASLLNNEQNVQECDARDDDSSCTADYIK